MDAVSGLQPGTDCDTAGGCAVNAVESRDVFGQTAYVQEEGVSTPNPMPPEGYSTSVDKDITGFVVTRLRPDRFASYIA